MKNPDQPARLQSEDGAQRVAWIERSVLVLLFLGLVAGAVAVLKPFVTAILFGAILASAAWPLRQLLVRNGLKRGAAATVLLLLSVALIAVPTLYLAPQLTEQLSQGIQHTEAYFSAAPQQPAWIGGVPLVGKRLGSAWDNAVNARGNIRALLEPYTAELQQTIVAAAQALADSVVQVILSLVVATMFWANGDPLIQALHASLQRLGGKTGDHVLYVAAGATRSVAYGVVGTAVVQAVLMTIGLAVAGVPGAMMIGFVTFLLALSQIGGPLLVLIWGGAAWWLFGQEHQAWGVVMIVWGVCVSMVDNFIKPWLISFGISMPLSLTILGVFGGFIAFGFLGLFIGPTLIAVIFTLLQAWQQQVDPASDAKEARE